MSAVIEWMIIVHRVLDYHPLMVYLVTMIQRHLASSVLRALKDRPVVLVNGPRQSGKSTLLLQEPALRNRRYLSLDDFATLAAARNQPEFLLESPQPTTLDEVQKLA